MRLVLQTVGGLCSRLRAVIGAIGYCQTTGRKLEIWWPVEEPSERTSEFPCRMRDIWDHPYEEVDKRRGGYKDYSLLASDDKDVIVRTDTYLIFLPWCKKPLGAYLKELRPTPALKSLVDSVKGRISASSISVNVRSRLPYPGTPSPEAFVSHVAEIVQQTQAGSVYLATDSPDSQAAFQRLCPIVQEKDYNYGSKLGILRQAADIYLTAACDWFVGSPGSWSQTIAFLRGAEPFGDETNWIGGNGEIFGRDVPQTTKPQDVVGRGKHLGILSLFD